MTRLILVNLYRMRKYRLTRHLLLPVCFLSIFCAVAIYTWTINTLLFSCPGNIVTVGISSCLMIFLNLFLMPVLVHFIYHAFHDRTAGLECMSGYSVHQMLLGRLVAVSAVVVMTMAVMITLAICAATLKNGWYAEVYTSWGIEEEQWRRITMADIVCWIGISLFTILQFAVICVLAACICRDSGIALLFVLAIDLMGMVLKLWMGTIEELNSTIIELSMAFCPGYQMMLIGEAMDDVLWGYDHIVLYEHMPSILAVGILEVALLYVFSYYAVKKRL